MKDLKLIECREKIQWYHPDDQAAILYMWIKQDHISMRQFTLLYGELTKIPKNQHTT